MSPASKNGKGGPPAGSVAQLAALDASIRRGLADAEAGRTKPAEDVFERLESKYRGLAGH